MAREAWWERGTVVALALALLGVGWRDAATYRRERQRRTPGEAALVDFLRAGDPADEFRGSSVIRSLKSRIVVEGLDAVELGAVSGGRGRHGLGPATRLLIFSEFSAAELSFAFHNFVDGQDITVRLNDELLEALRGQPVGEIRRTYRFDLRPGQSNALTIEYARYNHGGATVAASDPRKIAATFSHLTLRFR